MNTIDYQDIEKIVNNLVLKDQFLNPFLKKLTEEEIKQLVFRYYSNDNCSQIIKDYNLNLPISGICNVLPYYYDFNNKICPYCEDVLVGKLLSLQCKHEFSENCCCENCVNIRKNNINKE